VGAPAGKPVVRVNGVVLTDRDLARQMMNIFPYARQHGGHFPQQLEPEIRRQALQQMEFEELVYQDAVRRGMTVTPATLAGAVAEFKKQFDSEAEYQRYLTLEQGGSVQRLREKVRRAILIDQALTTAVTRKAVVSDAQMRAFYDQNQERFRKPDTVALQTISIVIPDSASAKDKAEARKRARVTKNYEEFGMLAEKISEDNWRVMMGDHKSVHRGRMPPEVEKIVFAMQPGEVSDLIETENSYCIARVNAREEAKLIPLEQVRAKLKKDMEANKADELRKALESRLRKHAKLEEL
jgi:peptidyl-prolyl cis-trans isomerase C